MSRTVAIHHVRAAVRGAGRAGVDPAPLLRGAGIGDALLADDRARVTPEQFTRLVQALWRATGDEFLGLGPAPCPRGAFAMMGHAVINSPDLGAALRRCGRFYGLFPYGLTLTLSVSGDTAVVAADLGETADPDHFLIECVLVVAHRFANWLIGHRIPLRWTRFGYPRPSHAGEYDLLFGCPPDFDRAGTEFGFDARWLAAPLIQDERTLTSFLANSPADLLARRDYGSSVADRIGRALAHRLRDGAGLPGLTEIAAGLAMSPATLRRKLAAEEVSFLRVKDGIRRDAAITSLVAGEEPIAALAARLGFSETAAFHRAFKRWTGATPAAYRSRRRAER